tara:strand:+ start:3656 stop:3835 length:180 start_codon:yes stop_codon:yes gene_type:complete
MKYIIFFLVFFMSSCSNGIQKKNLNYDLDLFKNKDISFDEFRIKLEEYARNSSYPNLDN